MSGKTPIRTVRVSEELWLLATRRAADNGETVSDVIRRALEQYTETGDCNADR